MRDWHLRSDEFTHAARELNAYQAQGLKYQTFSQQKTDAVNRHEDEREARVLMRLEAP